MIDPISTSASPLGIGPVGFSGDNERTERVPDNEAAEASMKTKAPLPDFQGRAVDLEA